MSDRKLIELAAKAAGIEHPAGEHCVNGPAVWDCNSLRWWRPLTDDGDAMRLAVKLHISVSWSPSGRSVKASVCDNPFLVFGIDATDSDCADVRRAIVSAAAAIGEAM